MGSIELTILQPSKNVHVNKMRYPNANRPPGERAIGSPLERGRGSPVGVNRGTMLSRGTY